MKYRRALLGVAASASLLGTAGVAHATHQDDPTYSPCRPGPVAGETRLGYSDEGDSDDPRHELPTIYAYGDEGGSSGYAGICGGGGGTDPEVQYLEVGGSVEDGPYVAHSDASTSGQPTDELGSATVGNDYVEVDGTEGNAPSGVVPQLDGYLSAGLTEADGEPGVCASGDNDHDFYEEHPTWKDCNEELPAGAAGELPLD